MTSDNQNKPSQKKTASRKPASKPAAKPAVKENGQKKAAPARGSAKNRRRLLKRHSATRREKDSRAESPRKSRLSRSRLSAA